jgi:glycosyltransferase involved in cell wall biosynthesis
MHIAISIFDDMDSNNGTNIRLQRILPILAKIGSVTIFDSGYKKSDNLALDQAASLHLGRTYMNNKIFLKLKPRILKLFPLLLWNFILFVRILKYKPRMIWCEHDWFGFPSILLISKLTKAKVIFEAHSILSEEARGLGITGLGLRIRILYEIFVIKNSQVVIALSSNTYEFYREYANNIELIPVFVDEELFTKRSGATTKGDNKYIGLVGPFTSVRGKGTLEFVYKNLDKFNSRIRFVVIGKCADIYDNERMEYAGYLNTWDDFIERLSNLNAVLVAEKLKTSGPLTKIIDSMACGVPVFTTPPGLVGLYWIENGRDIFAFDENEMVSKVNELIFNDELMRKTAGNARKIVEQYYGKKVNEQKITQILKQIAVP